MNQNRMDYNRVGWIDIAKAAGMIVVLINHAELGLGMVTFLGGMFYMPVFFVLAGYTYHEKQQESFGKFAVKKAKRLLVPYFWFQLFLTGIAAVRVFLSGGAWADIIKPAVGALYSRNVLYPEMRFAGDGGTNIYLMNVLNAPLWFLTGLFVTLCLYKGLLLSAGKGGEKKEHRLFAGVFICVVIGVLLRFICPVLLPWSLDTAFLCVGFLYAGNRLAQNGSIEKIAGRPLAVLAIGLVFAASSLWNGSMNLSVRDYGRSGLVCLVSGITGAVLCMLASMWLERHGGFIGRFLRVIGQNTIGILALHLLFFAIAGRGLAMVLPDISIEAMKTIQICGGILLLTPLDSLLKRYMPFLYGSKGELYGKRK